jgi:phospholipase/carboxylesterase
MTQLLPHLTRETGATPQYRIIWLHGLGADGSDFLPIANRTQLPAAVRYIFPHAPQRPVTLNGGYIMSAWYDLLVPATADGAPVPDALQDSAGLNAAQAEIEKFITQEQQRGIPPQRIFLAGFSQGGALALHTGLRHAEPLAGIIALSTYLPLAQSLPAARNIPIFMAHGKSDPVLPYNFGHASAQRLRAAGYALEWREYAMPHAVCSEEITDVQNWLAARMGRDSQM